MKKNIREKRIKKWLLDKGIRQKDVVEALGLHPAYVTFFVKGQRQNQSVMAVRDKFIELGLPQNLAEIGKGK